MSTSLQTSHNTHKITFRLEVRWSLIRSGLSYKKTPNSTFHAESLFSWSIRFCFESFLSSFCSHDDTLDDVSLLVLFVDLLVDNYHNIDFQILISLFLAFFLGHHYTFQVGSVDHSSVDLELPEGIINLRGAELFSPSHERVSEPAITGFRTLI